MNLTTQTSNSSQQNTALKDIEELTLSLVIQNFNPTLLSYDFLNMSGIVPKEWELASQPIINQKGSPVSFKNGLNIIAQPNTISFIEGLGTKELKELQFANIAQKYVEKMSNAQYQAINVISKIITPFSEDKEGGKNFINDTLLRSGVWRNFGNIIPQASVNLLYQLDECQLGVNINPAQLQQEKNIISAVLFAGNFNYNLTTLSDEVKITKLTEKINNWEKDLTTFRELIYQKFLQKAIIEKASLFDTL